MAIPAEDRWAPVRDRPAPHAGDRAPLVWLLGAHGGAGVSTLEQMLAPAADANGCWPGVHEGESPFVVVVARETLEGLAGAHELLRQHHGGHAGPSTLLGLITCADRPGRAALEIRRYRRIIDELVPAGGRWRIGWQPAWPVTRRAELPVWEPASCYPARGRDPLAAVRPLGHQLLGAVTAVTATTDHLLSSGKTA
ncbi:hypothetical protein [Nocardia sp. BMG111209]|uniref:hypothetical protein n=1 Tax=Nocardia sp. BMG111209 TaxID=1160137 RepID=UPI0012DD0817|nr:hypothetical protein [Nocardia sp. BMG111209]